MKQTQVCVESAVKRVKEDKDNYLVQYVRGVFKLPAEELSFQAAAIGPTQEIGCPRRMETSGTGVITWDDFQSSVNSKDMKELLLAAGIPSSMMACFERACVRVSALPAD